MEWPWGCDGGQVVTVLAFHSNDTSLNPAEVYSFYSVNCLKRTNINKKEAGNGPFLMWIIQVRLSHDLKRQK